MNIRPIHTEKDYEQALSRIDSLMDAKLSSSQKDELEILTTLVESYEKSKTYELDIPDPIEAIKFRMEQEGLTRKDMEAIIGGRGRISEILSKKRGLTLTMIRKLNEKLNIPARSLIKTYKLN